MDLRQRYTEAINNEGIGCELDTWFLESMYSYSITEGLEMLSQVLVVIDELPTEDGFIQEIAGVVNSTPPMFFVVDYIKQTGDTPLLISIRDIDCDTYLDFILKKQSINYYLNL